MAFAYFFEFADINTFAITAPVVREQWGADVYAYAPELYGTEGRSLGTSVAYGLGRLSNAVGPLMIAGVYNGVGYQAVFMVIAGTWTLGALVLAVFGPATRRRRLAAEAAAAGTGAKSVTATP